MAGSTGDATRPPPEVARAPSPFAETDTERRERLAACASLVPLLRPRSVAVVGASRREGSLGGAVLRNLVMGGFTGPVFPVNEKADVVLSMPAWKRLSDIPWPVDLAVIVVPAAAVAGVIDDARTKGVRAVVVLSAGFAETGPEGRAAQDALLAQVRAAGMRMVGPNCLGVMDTHPLTRLNATFTTAPVRAGSVAMSSQSGALAVAILEQAAEYGIGFSSFVSVGNKADVSGNDLLLYWGEDERTRLVLLYLESFGNPRRFARIARRVARRKPILAVKSGRSAAGRRAASSHTASLASSEAGTDALLRQAGVLRTQTLEEMFEAAALLAHQPLPAGPRVGVLTNAGGPAILCADACEGAGLTLPPLAEATRRALAAILPPAASLLNPVDMIAGAGPLQYERALPLLLDDPQVDAVIVIHTPVQRADVPGVARAVRRARAAAKAGRDKPLLVCALPEAAALLSANGDGDPADGGEAEAIPVYRFPESAARALSHAWIRAAWLRRPEGTLPELPGLDIARARAACRAVLARRGAVWMRPDEVAELLAAAGLPAPPLALCRNADEAVAAAQRLGFPVVLKLASDTIVHKSDVRGVHLGLLDAAAVRAAFGAVTASLATAGKSAELLGVTVQPMVGGGVELMMGLTQDPTFGPLVAFGSGGTSLELFADVAFRITPLTDTDAAEMLEAPRSARLLDGWRGSPPLDKPALADMLQRVARLADLVPEIAELDLNPVAAFPRGRGAQALDARVLLREVPGGVRPAEDRGDGHAGGARRQAAG
jgi:acetate---CoA ligase (ADP-forming)